MGNKSLRVVERSYAVGSAPLHISSEPFQTFNFCTQFCDLPMHLLSHKANSRGPGTDRGAILIFVCSPRCTSSFGYQWLENAPSAPRSTGASGKQFLRPRQFGHTAHVVVDGLLTDAGRHRQLPLRKHPVPPRELVGENEITGKLNFLVAAYSFNCYNFFNESYRRPCNLSWQFRRALAVRWRASEENNYQVSFQPYED